EVLTEPVRVGAAVELGLQPLKVAHERAEPQLARDGVGESPLLEALLDVADARPLAGLAQQALEPAPVGGQECTGERRELDPPLPEQAFELVEETLELGIVE